MKPFPARIWLPICLAAGAVFAFFYFTDDPPPSQPQKCMVWRIDGENATVYLAGSIHVLHEGDYPLPSAYEEAYADSARIVFEVPPEDLDSSETAATMETMGTYPTGESIDDHISEEATVAVDAYLAKSGMPAEEFKKYRPWMFSVVVGLIETMKEGAAPEFGIDHFFEQKASADEKPTDGLETSASQIAIFENLSARVEEQMLVKTLHEIEGISDQFKSMLKAWKIGDSESLHAQMFKDAGEFPDLMNALLYERNAIWIDQIVRYLEGEKNVMVIVGACHLVGEKSVIDLLEKRGYKAEQLTYSPSAKE